MPCGLFSKDESCHSSHHPIPPPHHAPKQQDFLLSDGTDVKVPCGKEVEKDFTLKRNPCHDFGTISGKVKDPDGHGIPYALVKVFDCDHKPLLHVFTNKHGYYLICLPPGHYILKAVK